MDADAATGDEANHLMKTRTSAMRRRKTVQVPRAILLELSVAKRVGVMGFCMGGALAMLGVMHGKESTQRAFFKDIRRPKPAIRQRQHTSKPFNIKPFFKIKSHSSPKLPPPPHHS